MNVQAEVSLYPLRTPTCWEAVERFVECLREGGLDVRTGPMSSHVRGQSTEIFPALAEAFERAALQGDVVLTLKVSNACPSAVEGGPDPAPKPAN